jgi:hypothetical protein
VTLRSAAYALSLKPNLLFFPFPFTWHLMVLVPLPPFLWTSVFTYGRRLRKATKNISKLKLIFSYFLLRVKYLSPLNLVSLQVVCILLMYVCISQSYTTSLSNPHDLPFPPTSLFLWRHFLFSPFFLFCVSLSCILNVQNVTLNAAYTLDRQKYHQITGRKEGKEKE